MNFPNLDYQMNQMNQMDHSRQKPHTFLLLLILLLTCALFVFVFQVSWNYTMPSIFGIGNIDFLQAFLLLVVVRILMPNCPIVNMILAAVVNIK